MKKLFLVFYILALVLAVAVVPLGLYVFSFPLWAAWIFIALPVVTAFYASRRRWVIIRAAVGLIAAAACFVGTLCNPYWSSWTYRVKPYSLAGDAVLTREQACADLKTIVESVKRVHPRFLSEPDLLDKALDDELKSITGEITVNELHRAAQRMVSTLGEGHSTVYAVSADVRYRRDYAELTTGGYEVTAINGEPIWDFFRRNSFLFSYEAESWGMYLLKNKLYSTDGLEYLDISPAGYSLTFSNGEEEITRSYTDADHLPYERYMEENARYYENRNEAFVSYEINEEKSLAVLTLRSCEYNDEYKKVLREMFAEVQQKGIRNVAADLRGNGGGSSLVANEFMRYLDTDSYLETGQKWRLGMFLADEPPARTKNNRADIIFTGDVYILCGASSFSSAMLFAEYIKDNSLGTLIGEAPGNAASSYGDITVFRLPNSGLLLQTSTKYFVRPNAADPDIFVEPDIPCGEEAAMDVLLEKISQKS